MIARLATLIARVALTGWLILVALFAFASTLGNPGPFVLFAFVIGASPLSLFVRRYHWAYFMCGAVATAALPVWLLASYGADDGGVSGVRDTTLLAVSLTILAYGLECVEYGIGRIVWPYPGGSGPGTSTEL